MGGENSVVGGENLDQEISNPDNVVNNCDGGVGNNYQEMGNNGVGGAKENIGDKSGEKWVRMVLVLRMRISVRMAVGMVF